MAVSQCVKCGNGVFELVAKIPMGSSRKVMFIQCSACGGVVGVQEDPNQYMKRHAGRLEQLQEPIRSSMKTKSVVESDIDSLIKYLYG